MANVRVKLIVRGRVQGVYFRQSTREHAERLGLCGWVANRDDGSVELEAEGSEAAVRALVAWAHRGPPAARVESVDEHQLEPAGGEPGFHVRR